MRRIAALSIVWAAASAAAQLASTDTRAATEAWVSRRFASPAMVSNIIFSATNSVPAQPAPDLAAVLAVGSGFGHLLGWESETLWLGASNFSSIVWSSDGAPFVFSGAPLYGGAPQADAGSRYAMIRDLQGEIAPAVAAATNSLVQSYFLGTNAYLVVSNALLRVEREAGGTNALIWSQSAQQLPGIDPAATQQLWAAIGQLQSQMEALPNSAAWGRYAPDGSPNPDPDFMTFINSPALVHGAGFQWATFGTVSFLCASGTVAFAGERDGEWRMGPDLYTNWFGYVVGGSIIVGAMASRIDYNAAEMIANIVYPYGGGDFPVMWFSPDLSLGLGSFQQLPWTLWIDNGDGTATANCSANTDKGYYYATTTHAAAAYFVSKMPARFDGGIFGATNSAPVRYDSTITIQVGGISYRVPAEAVP
jgi:hypothetical protein